MRELYRRSCSCCGLRDCGLWAARQCRAPACDGGPGGHRASAVQESANERKLRADQSEAEKPSRLVLYPGVWGLRGNDRVPGRQTTRDARASLQHGEHLRRAAARVVGIADLLLEPSLPRRNALPFEAKVGRWPDLCNDSGRPNLQRLRHRRGRASRLDVSAMLCRRNSRSVRRYPSRDRSAFQRYDDHRCRVRRHRNLSGHASQSRVLRTIKF